MDQTTSAPNECARVLLLVLWIGLLTNGVDINTAYLPDSRSEAEQLADVQEEFAREHLEVIARAPHASGTDEAKHVREYIHAELEGLGVDTQLISGNVEGVELVDVFARIPGRGDGGVLLLACHYDSVDRGGVHVAPGAGDDGAAAASMLEVARVLTTGEPLANDIWLLFTDGEELGLYGAKLFCRDEALIEQIDVVFNFEGIGNNGPSVMFQTSAGNSKLIDEFAQLNCAKVAPSFSQAIYERMPNDTDFTVFAKHGLIGLNFAIIGGRSAYHRAWDTPANLTPGTLQHQLETVHALAQHFGHLDLSELRCDEDQLYFDLLGSGFVHFSEGWGYGVFAFGLLGLVNLLWLARKRSVRVVRACLTTGGLSLVLGVAVLGLAYVVPVASEVIASKLGVESVPRGDALSAFLLTWGAVCAGLAALLTWLSAVQWDATRAREASLGSAVLWCGLAVASLVMLPLGSYFATVPLLLVAATAPAFWAKVSNARSSWLASGAGLAVMLLLLPSLGLIVSLLSVPAIVPVVLCAVAVGLAGPLLLPLAYWANVRVRGVLIFAWTIAVVLLASAGGLRAVGL